MLFCCPTLLRSNSSAGEEATSTSRARCGIVTTRMAPSGSWTVTPRTEKTPSAVTPRSITAERSTRNTSGFTVDTASYVPMPVVRRGVDPRPVASLWLPRVADLTTWRLSCLSVKAKAVVCVKS